MICKRCGFESPAGFEFCGKCGAVLGLSDDRLSDADTDHLRLYLPALLIESLQLDPITPSADVLQPCITRLSQLLEIVSSHLPAFLVEQVLRDPRLGKTGGQFLRGTLLFADISGFTAMSERLSRIGREGAEEITAIVNRYFDAMLSVLHAYHGQVIEFGGDALLGLFREPTDSNDPPSNSAARAIQAALDMQTTMSDFHETRTSQGFFELQMKVGVHRGQFFAAQLGTRQGMEYGLFGADVNATALAESAATAGQVVVNQTTLSAIGIPCPVTPVPNHPRYWAVSPLAALPPVLTMFDEYPTFPVPAAPTLVGLRQVVERLDALSLYLPAGLLGRLASITRNDTRDAELEGEHRTVASLFANIRSLGKVADDLGPGHEERVSTILNRYFTAMQESIHRFGGVINKIDLYGHGEKILALFGAPLAHADDAERAARTALSMHEALTAVLAEADLPDLQLDQRIGINDGFVFAGYVGSKLRREYTVMGDEVNLAARLMSVAGPGDVLVSSNIRRKVQATFAFEPRGEVSLKGKSKPVPIFAVVGLRPEPEAVRGVKGMRSPLVGRQLEWAQLLMAQEALRQGRGQIVSIIGEAGLGKSRLIAELRQAVFEADDGPLPIKNWPRPRWIEAHCLSFMESVSYFPFVEVVRQLAGIRTGDGESEAWNKLQQIVQDSFTTAISSNDSQTALAFLAHYLSLPLDEALHEKVRHLDAEALQRRTFFTLRALLEGQAKTRPLLLVLDDLHWMDQASLALLEYLMPLVDRVPLMLLLAYRPDHDKGCWRIREKAAREFTHCAVEMTIQALKGADGQQLLTNLTQMSQWPPQLLNLILDHAEGNPLYVEEILRTLIDEDVLIQNADGSWDLTTRPEAIHVPNTVQGVMMERLDRLEEPIRRVALAASVVGRTFPFDVLTHLAVEQEVDLHLRLAPLQQHDIIREAQRTPELIYVFKHSLMQEVCYNDLSARVRHLYHRKAAEYLELRQAVDPGEAARAIPLIAYHAFAGEDWPRARQYQLLAGQHAQQICAYHAAIDHFQKALAAAENASDEGILDQRLAAHLALGELLTTTSQFEAARAHLAAARSLATERGDPDRQVRSYRWLGRNYELSGDYPSALESIQAGMALLGERETSEAAEMLLIAGLIHTRQGDTDGALHYCQNAIRIATPLGEITALARAYNLLGIITRRQGMSAAAINHFQQAFDLYQQAGDIHGQALSHNLIANASFDLGHWHEADQHFRQASETFSQTGDAYNQFFVENNLGWIALNQGRLDEALAFYRDALRSLKSSGKSSPYLLGALHNSLGATHIRRSEAEAALQNLHDAQVYFEQGQVRDENISELHCHYAEVALLSGDPAEAEAQGQLALSLARELAARAEEGKSLHVLAEAAQAARNSGKAEDWLRAGLLIFEEISDQYEGARCRLSLAGLLLLQERQAECLTEVDHCIEVFQRLGAELDLAAASALKEKALRSN